MDTSLILPDAQGWVNARVLHEALGVKTRFADWVKRNLCDQKAIMGNDYSIFQSVEKKGPNGEGRPRSEYLISLFMAEHFAIMERTDKGREVRDVYIACRRAAEQMVVELAKLRAENAALKAPKRRRLPIGGRLETVKKIVETCDIFGNVEIETHTVRKYRDELTAQERRLAEIQHMSRVQEGLAKAIKEKACGDDVKPGLKLVKGA